MGPLLRRGSLVALLLAGSACSGACGGSNNTFQNQPQPGAPGGGMSGSVGNMPSDQPAGGNSGGSTGNTGGNTGGTTSKGGTGVLGPEAIAAWDALPAAEKDKVKQAKVFFGHQSVGWNTLEGVQTLGGFNVDEISAPTDYGAAKIGHAYLDTNGEPLQKMQNYETYVGRLGKTVQVAAMKLCWIDFDTGTNVGSLETTYQSTLTRLKSANPSIHFLHITTPIKTNEPANNALRLQYGDWLKNTFKNEAVVLDLAAIESTKPDGSSCTNGGQRALCSTYASDEGHLNAAGEARAAKAFLYAVYKSL